MSVLCTVLAPSFEKRQVTKPGISTGFKHFDNPRAAQVLVLKRQLTLLEVHTLNVPFGFFMYETRNMSTGRSADVMRATAKAKIAVMVEITSLSRRL